jgi:hypothetical protein
MQHLSDAPNPLQVAELLDLIIDHLHDHRKTLADCSLVCKAWLSSSRYHLFFRIHVADTASLTRFLNDLDSPLSTIAPFVRALTLRKCDYLSPLDRVGIDVSRVIPPQTAQLDPRTVSLSHLKALRKLALAQFHFNHFGEFVDMVSVFPLLEEISLDGVQWEEDQIPPHRSPPKSLQVICLGDCAKEQILNWLISEEVAPTVKIVNLRHIIPSQMLSIRRFLRVVGPSLEQLHFGFFNFDWSDGPGKPPALLPYCLFAIISLQKEALPTT